MEMKKSQVFAINQTSFGWREKKAK